MSMGETNDDNLIMNERSPFFVLALLDIIASRWWWNAKRYVLSSYSWTNMSRTVRMTRCQESGIQTKASPFGSAVARKTNKGVIDGKDVKHGQKNKTWGERFFSKRQLDINGTNTQRESACLPKDTQSRERFFPAVAKFIIFIIFLWEKG